MLMKVSVIGVLILYLLINTVNGNEDRETLFGNLRKIPEINLPSASIDSELQDCRTESNRKSKVQTDSIKTVANELKTTNKNLDSIVAKSQADQTRLTKVLDEKTLAKQKLRQDLVQKDLELMRKFDCKANHFTIKQCRSYCKYPYSYDSCIDTNTKLTFVRQLEDKEGRCIHHSYVNSAGSTCNQIHVIVA